MLNKNTSELLKYLTTEIKDDTFKVLEISQIIKNLSNLSRDELKEILDYLTERNYINVKYCDNDVYCIGVLPKGRLHNEEELNGKKEKKVFKYMFIIYMLLSFGSAFLGTMLALWVFFR